MAKSKYPYDAFVVGPSMTIRSVTVASDHPYYGSSYVRLQSGKNQHVRELHRTKAAALESAEEKMSGQEQRLAKQIVAVQKRRATLEKAKLVKE